MITVYSKNKIYQTFAEWEVPSDFADPVYNYVVHGFAPGGFFTSVIANDWAGAIQRSHPSNTVEALKTITGWIQNHMPSELRGSYNAVEKWCYHTSPEQRLAFLIEQGIVYDSRTETVMALKGAPDYDISKALHY